LDDHGYMKMVSSPQRFTNVLSIAKMGATNSSPNGMALIWFKKSTPTELTKLLMRMD